MWRTDWFGGQWGEQSVRAVAVIQVRDAGGCDEHGGRRGYEKLDSG